MSEPTTEKWKALRKAFPAAAVGKIPKGNTQLDFVGHAAVTDRLLEVDPAWNWEPVAFDERGLPALDSKGNLWIKLTVLGVTRYGYGDGSTSVKELIGDALRNAAMRFGVALDLWSKEELESTLDDPATKNVRPGANAASTANADPLVSSAKIAMMLGRAKAASGLKERQAVIDYFTDETGKKPTEVHDSEVEAILAKFNSDTEVEA